MVKLALRRKTKGALAEESVAGPKLGSRAGSQDFLRQGIAQRISSVFSIGGPPKGTAERALGKLLKPLLRVKKLAVAALNPHMPG
jgi:hypothetical protein